MKKILCLILSVIIFLPLLSGCSSGKGSGNGTTGADSTAGTTASQGDDGGNESLDVIKDGTMNFSIVRPSICMQNIIDALVYIRDSVSNNFSIMPTVAEDWVAGLGRDEIYESDSFEILIGETNRKESHDVLATLEKGEYKACVVGNKIVLIGTSDALTVQAVNLFVKEYFLGLSDATELIVPRNMELSGKREYSTIGDTDATLRIMTFNILGSESINERMPYIVDIVENYEPGIVCFQECNAAQHNATLARLTDYTISTVKHPGTSTVVYTPILYRTEKYTLKASGVEWLDSRYEGTNTKSLAWAVFEDKETKEVFSVINIHGALWTSSYPTPAGETYDTMRAKAVVWREDNVRQMNDRMTAVKAEYGDIPVLWTGDFNFNSSSSAYNLAVNTYHMSSAQTAATVSKVNGASYHGAIGSPPDASGLAIDHVFGNDKVDFYVHYICKSSDELKASDHCAVFADVAFKH